MAADLSQLFQLLWLQPVGRGEVDGEGDVEVSFLKGVLVGGHSLTLDHLDITGLNDLAWGDLDQQLAVIQVGDHKLAASEGGRQADMFLHNQITVLASEDGWGRDERKEGGV